jgi:hypothetical protein
MSTPMATQTSAHGTSLDPALEYQRILRNNAYFNRLVGVDALSKTLEEDGLSILVIRDSKPSVRIHTPTGTVTKLPSGQVLGRMNPFKLYEYLQHN